jgi:hypothetical protein
MTTNNPMQSCIDTCTKCYQTCLQTAMTHCLEMGGKHVEPNHFRLMINCAQICQTSAALQLSNSDFVAKYCKLCAEVCEACAKSCAALGGMDACEKTCLECAASCHAMAG